MTARVIRIGTSFLIVLAVYYVYALAIVPLIEPAVTVRARPRATDQEMQVASQAGKRNNALLERLFPPGAWERNEDVKVLETQQAKLLVSTYEPLPNGQVRLHPCTILFFPSEQVGTVQQLRERPVILEAPGGAVLQFDRPVDLRQARFGGDFVGGHLVGPIRIHSPPSRPGANDDIQILTRDVQLANQRITTPHPVDFRMGPNQGSGREMVITLASATEAGKSNRHGTSVGGVQMFELLHDVRLHLQLGGSARMPLSGQGPNPADTKKPQKASPPVEVTCRGPFRYDFPAQTATFTEQVDVHQLHENGQSDQLSCESLSITFAKKNEPAGAAAAAAGSTAGAAKPTTQGAEGFSQLKARYIEATGDPVIIRSVGRGAHARCQVLKYDVETQRITLEGDREVQLHQETNDIRARRLDYQPNPQGRLGRVFALGPGWLQGARRESPSQVYQARWTEHLSLRPYEHNQVLSLVGNASMQYTNVGALNADAIHLWFNERDDRAELAPRGRIQPVAFTKRQPKTTIEPEMMLAVGKVRVDSDALTARTARLEVWFRQAGAAQAADGTAPGGAQESTSPGNPASQGPSQNGVAQNPAGQNPLTRSRGPAKPAARKFDVGGGLVRVDAVVEQGRPDVSRVTVEGSAHLEETKTAHPGDKPLVVRGDRLHLAQANTEQKHIAVSGKPALIEAQGMSLSGAQIELEQLTNRMWISGAGRMKLPQSTRPRSRQQFDPGPLEITWQGQMLFDGVTASYQRAVVARGPHMQLRTERLDVALSRRIDFGDAQQQRTTTPDQQPDVAQLACSGGAVLDNRSFEPSGQASVDHMEARDLSIDRVSGAVEGHGPGVVTSVRRGSAEVGLATPGTQQAQRKPSSSSNQLSYLNVRFTRSISGNINRRELTFGGDVETTYGPVDSWEQTVSVDSPAGLGPKGAYLKCDLLTVREMHAPAPGQPAPVELEAMGNASVEGTDYRALANTIRYSREKDRVDLEGYGSSDAQLFRRTSSGPDVETLARKITFWRTLNQVKVDGGRYVDSGPLPGATKPRTQRQR